MVDTGLPFDFSAIPLFPLPNVVLFPRAVLPLHIFEERYKAMTADVLQGARQVAMSLLRPGWEKSYYARPEIDPVVCVGTVVSHERLPDGKFNFLLQGHTRAKVVRELDGDWPYRMAQLEPLVETPAIELDLEKARQRLMAMLKAEQMGSTGLTQQFHKLLEGPWATADVADLLAFNYLEDPWTKQVLLAETDVRQRVLRIVQELELMRSRIRPPSSTIHPPSLN